MGMEIKEVFTNGIASPAINHAVLAHVLHEMQQGNYNRCRALGLSEEDLSLLRSLPPTTLSRLAHSRVLWLRIDPMVLRRLVDQSIQDETQERLIDRALCLGASSLMMTECFGLTHSDTAQRRRLLDISPQRGRRPELSDEEKHAVWRRWQKLIRDDGKKAGSLSLVEQLDLMMLIAEEQNLNLAGVWQEIMSHAESGARK